MDHRRLREQFGFHLARLARLWRSHLDERLSPLGLTQAKWAILLHLSKTGGSLPQRELVDRVGVEGPTLVRLLDGLERLQLIKRHDCADDRRSKTIHLTELAGPVISDISTIATDLRNEILEGISAEDLATCESVLLHMAKNLGVCLREENR
ncbi:transcriptional regulator SlyA [Telmatospirillum sp.]|uniref:transcriptional regulator SlyA n=1 Tax=Telmatospirillum sp. TaxID=2079197 RepID=UPI002847B2D2|nr:transcriptional regulator SlyA [Telmatospirillum sp.]MDR3436255.1 transcriptional regulator SlyA [Telmatospirillum sp.]